METRVSCRKLLALLFLPVLLSPAPAKSSSAPLNDDVLGLIVFKADLGDPHQKLASWNEDDETPCKWAGVNCNPRTNRVTELKLDGFSLTGRVRLGLLRLQFLNKLSLPNNNLTGTLNAKLLQLENLQVVDFSNNAFSGSIPEGFFGQCRSLRAISLANNDFSGEIPASISSCSSLVALNLSLNQFSGSLPSGIWSLNALRMLDLSGNSLVGQIPKDIGNLSNLHVLNLSKNQLTGSVPEEICSSQMIKHIDLSGNSLTGTIPYTLQKLRFCKRLNLHGNLFEGAVPNWIGEMASLEILDLSMNKFSGPIPESIGKLRFLQVLNLAGNGFNGSAPESISNCEKLSVLNLSLNSLTGELPEWIFQAGSDQVSVLNGKEPNGNLQRTSVQSLQVLDLSHNSFSGHIGARIEAFVDLQVLNLSVNSLVGPIPYTVGELNHLSVLDMSQNLLNGSIPSSLQNCSSLQSLILSQNNLEGPIPEEIAKLAGLRVVDLSFNDLAGTLPQQLANLRNLVSFNVSHNQLQGELPAGGFFNTISPDSVSDNPSLCGSIVNKPCGTVLPKPIVLNPNSTSYSSHGVLPHDVNHKRIILSISSLIAISAAAAIAVGVIAISVINLHVRASSSSPQPPGPLIFSGGTDFSSSPATDTNSGKLVLFSGESDSFSTNTHALLNKDCELGRGGFGSVYMAVLRGGRHVAIKKLSVSSLVKSQEEFHREVKKLGKLMHQNLVSLQGYYWSPDLQLLIYDYVPGGSLYSHLHENPERSLLTWNNRFNIIFGTAKSLAYLHRSNIIHYNIKSSNVLIDDSGEPKVGDYGLASLLPKLDRYILSTKVQSALGYMAPELACKTVKITKKCDVYGFGVLILEVVTGKKPVEYMEDDVVVLCDVVRGAIEEGRAETCYDTRLQERVSVEQAVSVLELGLLCTSHVPSTRPDMEEVVDLLEIIRCRHLDSQNSSGSK